MSKKCIVCFTASYPFGKRETYFENELKYLSANFEKVIIIPEYNPFGNELRDVPGNVIVEDIVLRQGLKRLYDFIKVFKFRSLFFKEFFGKRVYKKRSTLKSWFLFVISYELGLSNFKKHDFDKSEVILYSYWASRYFFVDLKLADYTKVLRMHGGDFYESRNDGYLPIRKDLYNCADLLLPISKDINNVLVDYYGISTNKIEISYLGVFNERNSSVLKTNKILNVISCSNIYALKRINYIYDILYFLDDTIDVRWLHIGDGNLKDDILTYIKERKKHNISVEFVGQKTQLELIEIYENNYFDVFINTSIYEGLPVSIMEAFSYGIPTIATNVGGTSEIVNESNGVLINDSFDPIEVSKILESKYLSDDFSKMRLNAYLTWFEKFNANINYDRLVKELNNL